MPPSGASAGAFRHGPDSFDVVAKEAPCSFGAAPSESVPVCAVHAGSAASDQPD